MWSRSRRPTSKSRTALHFSNSERLIVADRAGAVWVFKVPPSGSGGHGALSAERLEGGAFRKSPGSVAAIPLGRDRYDILVCNNYAHHVTRHRLQLRPRLRVTKSKVLIKKGMNIPDGVAVSRSRRWIAISNHITASVLIFGNSWLLNARTRPVGVLNAAGYPHGVRFAHDDRFVLVADAGSTLVNVYSSQDGDWRGRRDPAKSFPVMSTDTYFRGRVTPADGGPKGIDIDSGMNVLVATNELLPLVFFDLRALLPQAHPASN